MNQLLFVRSILGAALLALLSPTVPAAEAVALRYRSPGDGKLYIVTKTTVEQTQSVNGQDLVNEFETEQTIERSAREPSGDGKLLFRDRTLRLRNRVKIGPVGEFSFDSKSSDRDAGSTLGSALTPLYEALSGAVVDLDVTPRGQILSVKGLKEAVEGALGNNPLAIQFAAGLNSEEGAKTGYMDHYLVLPEQPVSPGDTWENPLKLTINGLGTLEGRTKCRYEGPVTDMPNRHRIAATTELKVQVDLKNNGVEVTGAVSVTASRDTVVFDSERGVIVSRESQTTTGGDLIVSAGGQTIPIRQEQTQKMSSRLLDGPPAD